MHKHVFLFDIDGTLIHTGGAGGRALLNAFSAEFGVAEPAKIPFSGRTDRGIASNLFQAHGIENTPDHWHRLRDEYLRRLVVHLPEYQGRVLPGVLQLLGGLARRPDTAVGLLTGNAREGARLKLEHYDLFHHFSFGGFGDSSPDRNDVAQEAFAAALDHLKEDISPEQVWVIGDTPLDVSCARAIGAKAAAVATGWHSVEELEAAKPDLLLTDLEDTQRVIRLLIPT
jgi:phosphoglycolate phosphatase-like HAD superfamily hydrolase